MLSWKLAAWWVAVGCYVAAVWVWHLFSAEDLASPSAASWVQALGSIAAILVAVAVAAFQHSQDRAKEEERSRSEQRRVRGILLQCALDLRQLVQAQGETAAVRSRIHPGYGQVNYDWIRRRLQVLQVAVDSFSASQMPSQIDYLLLSRLQDQISSLKNEVRLRESLEDRIEGHMRAPNWNMHLGHATDLVHRLQHQFDLIDNPDAPPPGE